MREPVTVNLLTGFLGSGKTSLLRRLLQRPELARTAVLINEFGEVGLDHLLVEAVDEEVVLLKSGCICCSIRGDLREGLARLLGRRDRGEIAPFDRVVIETTGLADPVPIVASFSADPSLRWHFRLGAVITVVDAVSGAANLDRFEEAERQVAIADRLVVSKTDLVDSDVVQSLAHRLSRLNPTAGLHPTSENEAADLVLLDGEAHRSSATPDVGHHRHGSGLGTFVIGADEPLDWASFGLWLSLLLHRHGSSILRVKGLLHVAGSDGPVVVQGVQHLVHRPEHLTSWPDGRPATRLVVIGRDLDPVLVERSFRTFCGTGQSTPQGVAETVA
ncbi:MAG: GTP-binding protein [Geminicoccaceae bacterium]